ncbi:MAG: glycosyltransferase [Desulfamplus sp.]|nr:glycosyltransferase [Desulfamplus sp.]
MIFNRITELYKYCKNSNSREKKEVTKYIPDETLLKQWASSEWIEYQAWIFHKEFMTLNKWESMRNESLNLANPPLITVITPSYNTDPEMLKECIYSVQIQSYHNWEMCIADDGSKNEATLSTLRQFALEDPRIKVSFSEENRGICNATNRALGMATGEYIAFLDHDDRLAVNALFCVAKEICFNRAIDVIYSDRDMLSLNGLRFMHLFKPDWSPELLFSTNYICHLLIYRRSIINEVGGIHKEFEGSQDYDLILRVMELNPVVHHISKILYHWRQNEQSVALNHNIKEYAYKAGVLALKHALKRRCLEGDVSEMLDLWRGHYRVKLTPPPDETFCIIEFDENLSNHEFVNFLSNKIDSIKDENYCYFVFISTKLSFDISAIKEMVSWFQVDDVGLVTGKIINNRSEIIHAGMVQKKDGYPLFLFEGGAESIPGYMGVTRILRNVSSPHPYCFAIRKSLWNEMNGFDQAFKGPHAILDLALRASASTQKADGNKNCIGRTVYTPFAKFTLKANAFVENKQLWLESDAAYFAKKWRDYLSKGDPYYNEQLTLKLNDMGLNADVSELAFVRGDL